MGKRYAKKQAKSKKIKTIIIICLLIVVIVAGGLYCYYNKDHTKPEETYSSNSVSSKSDVKDEGKYKNPLTGLSTKEDYAKNRPYAIMINNIEQAQPLLGVSEADQMYECLVEGGITRILAVFQNPKDVRQIGSIRSARPDFINIAQGLDAIYFHIGASVQADEMLKNTTIDSFNLGSYPDMMWRDQQRLNNLGTEHSALTSGQKLIDGVLNEGTRTKLKSSYTFKQKFSESESQVLNGSSATNITATFSFYKNTSFIYDSAENEYLIYQFGAPQMDDNAGVQNTKKNIMVLRVNSYTIDDEGHMGMDLVNSEGNGKYISSGKCIDIKWSKGSENEPIKYKTTQGKDLIMMPGQSYICAVPLTESLTIE